MEKKKSCGAVVVTREGDGSIREVRLCTYEEAPVLLPADSRKAVLTAADHFLKEKADR